MALQLQWSLDRTTSSAISVAAGVLQAATRDNVQPLAIISCEKLGNTIAMCQETMVTVERLVVATPEPAALSFLKSTVGFFSDDTVSQLSLNTAGLRFLSFAAALLSTIRPSASAIIIQKMLESTTSDTSLLPTIRHIRDLLTSIEPRCYRSMFADQVVFWQLFINEALGPSPIDRGSFNIVPSTDGVTALMDALRELHRIGNDDITQISVQSGNCAAWTIAFIKWCLGVPPSIVREDGTLIMPGDGKVSVAVAGLSASHDGFKITMYSSVRGPSELVVTQSTRVQNWGMVSLRAFGQLRLDAFGANPLALRAVEQALPYALHQVIANLEMTPTQQAAPKTVEARAKRLKLSPFSESHSITKIFHLLFDKAVNLKQLGEGIKLTDLPVVRTYMRDAETDCGCRNCYAGDDSFSYVICNKDSFMKALCNLTADIIVLSLVDNPEGLMISSISEPPQDFTTGIFLPNFEFSRSVNEFMVKVHDILLYGRPVSCPNSSLMAWTLVRLGHLKAVEHGRELVVSSFSGQAVWPALFDSLFVPQQGYLRFSWAQGLIVHRNEVYEVALSKVSGSGSIGSAPQNPLEPISTPQNLFPQMTLSWQVSPVERELYVSLATGGSSGNSSVVLGAQAWNLFETLPDCFVMDHCAHSANASLETPDLFCELVSPLCPIGEAQADDRASLMDRKGDRTLRERSTWDSIRASNSVQANHSLDPESLLVVPVDGAEHLRFLSLVTMTSNFRTVLRRRACLACCLDVCRKINADCLVL